ncbi:MAG TPA: SpoIID/LytB domain-containing protein, partial [Gaiellaceae bacterium]|nr:SpoIID/LytB domain-containing protein [Gaiellaceae bacterium]
GGTTATATTTTQTVTSDATEVLAVSGHGWGHGLGLSQWGAYGYALHGLDYERILAHYYQGTTLGPAPARTVRVLLGSGKRLTLTSVSPWRAVDAQGTKVALDAGTVALTRTAKLAGRALTLPLTFSAVAPLQVNGNVYRGRISVSLSGKTLQAVDVVALESYLRGVVPAEVPSAWPAAVLQAQAVAARSYALANLVKGRSFDLYGDVRDQVYGGVGVESPATDAAVAATKGQVLLYAGKVADTLYFSTSGGRTASASEFGPAIPYLVSVSDPYDTTSPYHDWGPVLFPAASVAKRLKVASPLNDIETSASASGRVQTVTVVGGDGLAATFTGPQVRTALDLRSTWFAPSLLGLSARTTGITYGGAASLEGIARAAGAVSLEAQRYGQDWQPAGALQPGTDGTFSTIVKPQLRTAYRLAAGAVRVSLVTVSVSARCDATITSSGATGTLRPASAGAVQLQRGGSGAWTTVSSTLADAAGAFSFGGPLAPGDYRARCAPGAGIAPGLSAEAMLP